MQISFGEKNILSNRSCVVVLMYDFPKASLGQKVTFLIINKFVTVYSHNEVKLALNFLEASRI